MTDSSRTTIAILYQAVPPPTIKGIRKAAKPGGYSDSGADIAFALKNAGIKIVTPAPNPDEAVNMDWVFPDTAEGIKGALAAGANVLWANTVLFNGHPIEAFLGLVWVVGQHPSVQQQMDDKFATNKQLEFLGLPVAPSILVSNERREGVVHISELNEDLLATHGFKFPLMMKPVRGRGSFGVTKVLDMKALEHQADLLFAGGEVGDSLMLENFLSGEEVTVTVFPALKKDGATIAPWALRPVRRLNHQEGVAPYNGTVAVTENSVSLTEEEANTPAVRALLRNCVQAAEATKARAPIRIDCRADDTGQYFLFDLNAKPNMTGAGRAGRENQDSLSAMSARAEGLDYVGFLKLMLDLAWKD